MELFLHKRFAFSRFDSFGGIPDKMLVEQLPTTITFHEQKLQNSDSNLCGITCFYFFYLIRRMDYQDAALKLYFSEMPISFFGGT